MNQSDIQIQIHVRPSLRIVGLQVVIFFLLLLLLFFLLELSPFFETLWRSVTILGVVIIGHSIFSRVHIRYFLDPLELSEISGFFSKRAIKVPINRITDYQINRSFLQRILGLGSIYINTPGGLGYELVLKELKGRDLSEMARGLETLFGEQKIADAGRNEALATARKKALESDDGELDV